ncbi:MAG: NFACT family protein [Oscillospiraceae bacterium]
MSLDGALLSQVRHEVISAAEGARVEKIAQPTREELVLHLRWRGGAGKLLLSAGANSPRIHFTSFVPENPKSPPMFCMLLRKHLSSAKLLGIRQAGMDRILFLDFEAVNELGDLVTLTLAVEIMGRHSNIILIDQNNRILDSIKRVDLETSSVRQILPGMLYELPPMQDKLELTTVPVGDILARLKAGPDAELSKALMGALQGMSPLPCREVADYVTRGGEATIAALTDDQWSRLSFRLEDMAGLLRDNRGTPTMVTDLDGRPKDFTFLPVNQYGAVMLTRAYDNYSTMLDDFYAKRDSMERIKQRSGDLLRLLSNTSDRIARRLAAQREELLDSTNREELRIKGELLTANLHQIQKGDSSVRVLNYYDPEGSEMDIPLDIRLTPAQNAQHYYALYRKADTAERVLAEQIAYGEQELEYIDSVFDTLTRAENEADLDAIRQELAGGGYMRAASQKGKPRRPEKLKPLRFRSSDGFAILTGRNNVQNDQLTIKESRGNDVWLHTQKIPGSHTIIQTEGKTVPDKTMEEAGIIAAYYSKARESSKVPVDFTQVRNVKKPNGAKPGMVIYETYQTMIVDPDEDLVQKLAEGGK